jgi:drug/metabolite transporter (DMT)-like permease
VAYLLALLSAAFYGAADFLGGLASRAMATVMVVVVSQASGLLVLGALLPFLSESLPAARDLWWGLAAGVAGSVGVALLYQALSIGTMAIVAPVTAVCAVIIPVAAGVLLGERPAAHTVVGIAVALLAIVLVSQQGPATGDDPSGKGALPTGLGLALLSGVAIGIFFLALAQTADAAGLWPLVSARAVSLVMFGGFAVAQAIIVGQPAANPDVPALPRRALGAALIGGVLDMLANALYLIAVREGPLTAVVTLSSLYPASTVVLARVVLRERLRPVQVAGIAAALVAVVLIVSQPP